MDSYFNGQIKVSRDLRQNKRIVLGKFDLSDILFISTGVLVALIVGYLLGFSTVRIVDEFIAIIIAVIPMVYIISFGFKRIAGIRKYNYLQMKLMYKKSLLRFNRKIDNSQSKEKYIVAFEVDRKYVNKYINKFLSYNNLSLLQVRYKKDIDNKSKIYVLISLRYTNNDDVLYDLTNKFLFNRELKHLSYEEITKMEQDLNLKFIKKNDRKDRIKKIKRKIFINLFCKHLEGQIENKMLEIDSIKNKYKDRKYLIYMLNLYDNKGYRKFVNIIKRYAEVICYYKKEDKKKYVNTFLLIEEEKKKGKKLTKLEKVERLCDEYSIVLDRLTKEQGIAQKAISYYMTNPFNAYRLM